jgi:hypothetical protein
MAKIYHSIPKIGTGRFGFQLGMRVRLYAAPDHLLIVESTGYTEEYKRIAYGDIRYLTIVQTLGQIRQGMLSGGILFVILMSALWGLPWVAIGLLGAPFLVWFLVNLILGPTCRCYLNTHVQTVQLPVPRRKNKGSILLAFLKSRIPSSRIAGAEQAVV